ncbi:hypothetical protein BC643_2156 [Mangrovibacterium diazotrophicum]|uniref:Uncharacterized protein n=2 Tax=Mangrovibacterium diazotrophicum TaxID=1261403 RepID=A0A419W8M7_9BACT|nr:hypothetical protein BC643_2156 [Mangrovibacterium diazotrophicum]
MLFHQAHAKKDQLPAAAGMEELCPEKGKSRKVKVRMMHSEFRDYRAMSVVKFKRKGCKKHNPDLPGRKENLASSAVKNESL